VIPIDTDQTASKDISASRDNSSDAEAVSVRSSPHSYIAAVFGFTYFAAFLLYLEYDVAASLALFASWILVPVFAFNDRIEFDGRSIKRSGFLPSAWSKFTASPGRLKLADIEFIESHAVRAIRRGGEVKYRYRTTFRGKGLAISVASGGPDFREFIKAVLTKTDVGVMDNRSIDLREFLIDPHELEMKAEFARVPSSEALDTTLKNEIAGRRSHLDTVVLLNEEKAEDLLQLGNELRVAGALSRAFESIRRALVLRPSWGQAIFDLARCLYSIAGATNDVRYEKRSFAALRLAERRSGDDHELLARIGEFYAQTGHFDRAEKLFSRLTDGVTENFRAVRGLAEIALRDGKLARVVHYFSAAERSAGRRSLKTWAGNEASYFSRLNNDEEYMETEVTRVNSLESVERAGKTTVRVATFAIPLIAVGLVFEEPLVTNVGWAFATVSMVVWIICNLLSRMLSRRIPYELMNDAE
jgi:tetratricopeptide (TPR) repeat protein